MFSERPFETSMEDIALAAGCRAPAVPLLSTRAEYFGAIWQRVHVQLRQVVVTAEAPTVRDRVEAALVATSTFFRTCLPLVLISNRSSISADPRCVVRSTRTWKPCARISRRRRCARAGSGAGRGQIRRLDHLRPRAALAALVDERISLETCHDMCMHVLDAAVGSQVDLRVPPVDNPVPASVGE